jgi:hypothetical protein
MSPEHAVVPATAARKAGFITLVGCSATILGTSAPWLLRTVLGVSVTTSRIHDAVPALAALAVLSAGLASFVLLRRPAPAAVAIALVALALGQLWLGIWNAVNVLQAIDLVDSRLVLDRAIGTGVYLSLLGASLTLGAGVLAWRKRASRREIAAETS